MDHFLHPRNTGVIEDADGVGEAGNIVCGDLMRIYIKIDRKDDGRLVLKDVKFMTLGCVAAIASSSKVTEMAKNKTIEEALKITNQEIAESLGGLPPVKMHCSVLAADALKEAIYNYLEKNGQPIPPELEKEHKRILKERSLMEEKYGDFIERQRQVLAEKEAEEIG